MTTKQNQPSLKFVGGMSIKNAEDLAEQFSIPMAKIADLEGVVWSSDPDYQENMRAVFKAPEGHFYEVEASHCSCYGYSEQWKPSKISKAYVEKLIAQASSLPPNNEYDQDGLCCPEFIQALKELVK